MTYDPTQDAVIMGGTGDGSDGSDPLTPTEWRKWTLDSGGVWHPSQEPGSPPKTGGHLEWGLWNGQRVQHMVYGPVGSTPTKGVEPTRPPYYQRERYFDAMTGTWKHRWRYTPTNAEVEARRQGLAHDSRGYYRVVSGRRVYMTGHDTAGRRYHMQGTRRIWDDPAHWPSYYNRQRHAAQKRQKELKSELESLREQAKRARADQHILKRNIMRRIKATEADLKKIHTFLLRTSASPFAVDFRKQSAKFRMGVSVMLEVGTPDPRYTPGSDSWLNSVTWSTYARVGRDATVWIRATLSIQDPDWKPGILGMPEMLSTHWRVPKDWLIMDGVGASTDEWIISNPLYLVRTFRSPSAGWGLEGFSVKAELYAFTWNQPAHTHSENAR